MDNLELVLLGAPRVSYRGEALELQGKHVALLCFVALQGRPCTRGELTDVLWGPGRGGNLRTALYKLRGLPGADVWLKDGEFIEIAAQSDVARLEHARGAEHASDEVLTLLDACLGTDAGELLFGLRAPTPTYSEWLEEGRRRIAALVDETLSGAARDLRGRGRFERARVYAEALTVRNPLDEAAVRLLMRLEHDSGHPENVQRAFDRCRAALLDLGGEPDAETLKVRRELLGMDGGGARGILLGPGDKVAGRAAQLFGREALLERLDTEVRERPVLLHGFGGVGKTALAAELAVSWLAGGKVEGKAEGTAGEKVEGKVLWLQAGLATAAELVEAAGQALGVQGAAAQPGSLERALERNPVALFVLDDAWNEAAVRDLQGRLPDTLPLVVTARQRIKGLTRLDVGRLERPDARQLLAFGTEREFADDEADRVCDVLGDHPFALRLAGAKLRHDKLSPQQLLAQLANAPHTLQTPRGWREEGRESVSALLQASLEALSDNAYDAFLAVGALASGTVTAPLLARALRRDVEGTEAALIELHTRALAERAASPGSDLVRYTLHDLSHSFARQNTTVRAQTVVRACRDFVAVAKKDFERLEADIGNIVGALGAAQEAEERGVLVDVMAELVIGEAYFSARGHMPRSLSLLEVAVRWAKELGQLERAHHFSTKLGDARRVQYHQHSKALDAYIEATNLARLTKQKAREATLLSLCAIERHELGLSSDVDFEQAYQLAVESDNSVALGQVLQHRGYVAGVHGNWRMVERLNAEAVELAHKLRDDPKADQGRADDLLFFTLLNLGEAKRKLGKYGEAVSVREEALRLAEDRNNQIWQAYALHELGEMHLDVGEQHKAEAYLGEALELYEANHAHAEVEQVRKLLTTNSTESHATEV